MHAKKHLGQHFLVNRYYLDLTASYVKGQDLHLLEIGPGSGLLTKVLLDLPCCAHLTGIEKDPDMTKHLEDIRRMFPDKFSFRIMDATALEISSLEPKPLYLVGNLPYNISVHLIDMFLAQSHLWREAIFMVQREVARRINGIDTGVLSMFSQLRCTCDILFDVPSSAYVPAPKVESSVIRLRPHRIYDDLEHDTMDILKLLIRTCFGQRRKTIGKSLKHLVSISGIVSAGINAGARPQELSLDDFISLSHTVAKLSQKPSQL